MADAVVATSRDHPTTNAATVRVAVALRVE
jgi:hypothetical protein